MFWQPLQPDPGDNYSPRPMRQPRVLFRSMSIGELAEIMRSGKIVGGGNIFHDGETRPYVFFGDDLNESLLGNGESLDRCVAVALREHEIHDQLADGRKVVRWRARALTSAMRRDGIGYERQDATALRSGGDKWPLIRRLSGCPTADRAKYASLLRGYAGALRAHRRMDAKHYALLRAKLSELARRTVNQPYTSAVIVTYQVTGGLEYRAEFGGTLNHGEPEYGFRPGHLTTDDIMEVLLVKDGAIVRRIGPDRFSEIGAICQAAMAVELADEATQIWQGWWGGRLTVTCHASGEWGWSVEGGAGLFPVRMPWIFFSRSGSL